MAPNRAGSGFFFLVKGVGEGVANGEKIGGRSYAVSDHAEESELREGG